MRKIKASEIKLLREQFLVLQNNLCALCRDILHESEAVLDHCHTTGQIRGVLHRGCNALEGVIVNNMRRNRIDDIRLGSILANLQAYQKDLKELLHPTHRTAEERQQRAKKRAQARRKKR